MSDKCEMCGSSFTFGCSIEVEGLEICYNCYTILGLDREEEEDEQCEYERRIEMVDCTCSTGYVGSDGHPCPRCEGNLQYEVYV
jgi:hypothetical protein